MKYKLNIHFVGTSFEGWQSQPSRNTVQDHIEKALTTILRHKVRVTGCSRTDSGVHAKGLIASFDTDVEFEKSKILKSIQALVPRDIGVIDIEETAASFHPILDSKGKIYCYRIWASETRNPFMHPYVWHVPKTLEVAKMKRAAKSFIGKHNFKSFCASDSEVKTFEREIFEVEILENSSLLEIYISGGGFLKQMVRTIVGTLVDISNGKFDEGSIPHIIESQNRIQAGKTAPASGLTLEKVMYHNIISVADFLKDHQH
jgi:tRNA pseudouridine38-40 synthase